ncbi:DNA repair helicase, putative [Plasmodium knowlesi strain H]|uniref:DNA repair helicase, putative n=3 Tax=Plasmodium knowlesi TaxID=5850 RepID=A0A5K1VF16_PLAKH|nr:FANCJ-like helicase, putative [Plasmodium knowlesi strain H]OTN67856.1 putative DNA repair helicase [Plasmodium knowlesi]CAA9990525.1 FANCJ-like helicase, putative [Plasmodium knowlesi strain H]SBO19769.1 DNA repair helicase, putative [Plasmodium knowlesi strain H]SBO22430.1 DNA repair helicase, putative [Plasmodium knowlesi strain H]VVS79999.1 FANCJ-like helicase, putative [Plasmodium knowlesi strain H]|eukprot:XP_002260913.1 DNA-repair helicase, putative [Plasmodium knowlesi strain H]
MEGKIHKRYKVVKNEDVNHRYTINDVEVYFPYELYDCQYNYMLSVLNALKKKENAILESPTGTGKTLCLLCASISYLVDVLEKKGAFSENINITENKKNISLDFKENENSRSSPPKASPANDFPKIIYASRTHSQLKQVIKELKNVYFIKNNEKYKLLTTILGSRDQLCVHNINYNYKGTMLNNMCKRARKNGECMYHNGLKYLYKLKHLFTIPMDVETLSEIGKGNSVGQNIHFCPFYATREIQNECHVILLPYNYLFEESTRKILKLNLENSIIIIDEGHNIETVAEEAVSFKIKDSDLNLFLDGIKATLTVLDKVKDVDKEMRERISVDELFKLNRSITALISWLENERLEISGKNKIKEKHKTYEGKEIFDIFQKNNINITKDNFEKFHTLLTCMVELLNRYINDFKITAMDVKNINKYIATIDNIRKSFSILFSDVVRNCIEYFQLFINEEKVPYTECADVSKVYDNMKKFTKSKTKIVYDKYNYTMSKNISLLCFSATASLCGILKEKVNSIIVTSGTLSPIEPFSKQLSGNYFSFKHILENDHVIKSHQLFVGCMTHYNNQILLSTYENRSNDNYIQALGNCIFDLIICIPYGVLIFFSSYSSMTETVNAWKKFKIFEKINSYKTIFVEPNKAAELKDILQQYEYIIKKKRKGAILMGVCRGKISEGIDFKDDCCRGVIICGLPYGNVYDSKIIFKKEFLDNFKYEFSPPNDILGGDNGAGALSNNTTLSNISKGNKWYNEEAMRSINQSIGRVIRHKNDYGSIFFLDSRFSNNQRIKEISKWVRTHFRIYRDIEQIQSDIDKFFELFKGIEQNNLDVSASASGGENTKGEGDSSSATGNTNSYMKQIGKNFQDCYIKSSNNKTNRNKHSMAQNKFVFNPIKKMKNQPKILSMIQNITKGKKEEKSILVDDNKELNIFKSTDVVDEEKAPGAKLSSTKLENAKSLISSFREILSKEIYEQVFNLIRDTKRMSGENKYELMISKILELVVQNFVEERREDLGGGKVAKGSPEQGEHVKEDSLKGTYVQSSATAHFNDVMTADQLKVVWGMLVNLINNFLPSQEKEKCFLLLQKRFKERTTNFDDLEKYVYNYRLEKIEMI